MVYLDKKYRTLVSWGLLLKKSVCLKISKIRSHRFSNVTLGSQNNTSRVVRYFILFLIFFIVCKISCMGNGYLAHRHFVHSYGLYLEELEILFSITYDGSEVINKVSNQ